MCAPACYGWININLVLDISFFLFIFFTNKVQLRKFLMVTIYLCACKVNDSITTMLKQYVSVGHLQIQSNLTNFNF
jgi:hypothetical protein